MVRPVAMAVTSAGGAKLGASGRHARVSIPSVKPVTVALSNDYDVVVHGLEAMLAPFADRVRILELDVDTPTVSSVDVTLYDTFARSHLGGPRVVELLDNPRNGKVVLYSWNDESDLVQGALDLGCAGFLDKSLSAEELVASIEQIARGETVVPARSTDPDATEPQGAWPGQEHGLSAREAEILALITQGLTNEDIAADLYLSINTVKSYIRTAYRKIDVTRRSQAVRWGMEHGMVPDRGRELR